MSLILAEAICQANTSSQSWTNLKSLWKRDSWDFLMERSHFHLLTGMEHMHLYALSSLDDIGFMSKGNIIEIPKLVNDEARLFGKVQKLPPLFARPFFLFQSMKKLYLALKITLWSKNIQYMDLLPQILLCIVVAHNLKLPVSQAKREVLFLISLCNYPISTLKSALVTDGTQQ